MTFYADLHIHSSYSRATSRELSLEVLYAWARIKGLSVIGTGDCLHPRWLAECGKKLIDDGTGLFTLKPRAMRGPADLPVPPAASQVRFMLTTEISTIYKRGNRVRKVHHVVCLPSFAAANLLAKRLSRIGNLASDGRPILGFDSRDLLAMILEADERSLLIPAHIWTPWFSVLGSKSGFDSIRECYGDLTAHIHAVETGLSSDPAMNWRVSSLDPFVLLSFSDAHSPSKLGRECTVFDAECSYEGIRLSLVNRRKGVAGTIEFFPEEGKYHVDGHRGCGIRFSPAETIRLRGICPVCRGPLTVGVLSRVEELADREEGIMAPRGRPFTRLVSLAEVIGEALGRGSSSKGVTAVFRSLIETLGSELFILLDASLSAIGSVAGERVAEGVRRVRQGELTIEPGYDGEFGTVRIFADE